MVLARNVDRSEKLLKGCAAGFSSKIHSLKNRLKVCITATLAVQEAEFNFSLLNLMLDNKLCSSIG
jgi:hypothetical protein